MMDFASFERLKAEIEQMILSRLPEVDKAAARSLSMDLAQFAKKFAFSYSGVKLSYEDYGEINRLSISGVTQADLARWFNLSINTINRICNDKLLPHYKGS